MHYAKITVNNLLVVCIIMCTINYLSQNFYCLGLGLGEYGIFSTTTSTYIKAGNG